MSRKSYRVVINENGRYLIEYLRNGDVNWQPSKRWGGAMFVDEEFTDLQLAIKRVNTLIELDAWIDENKGRVVYGPVPKD